MAAVGDCAQGGELNCLSHRKRLSCGSDLDGTNFRIHATRERKNNADETQHLDAITNEHNLPSWHSCEPFSPHRGGGPRIQIGSRILVQ